MLLNTMFGSLLKKRQTDSTVGVEISDNGVALVHLSNASSAMPTLNHCEFIGCDDASKATPLLASRIKELGLQNTSCRLVLKHGSYQFLLVEAPKVPEEELNEALRWRIKDLLSFPVESAVIDAFLLPQDSARGGTRMAYVAVAEQSIIQQAVDAVSSAHLDLQSIDVAELCLRNLAIKAEDCSRGLAIVHLMQGGGALQVLRNNQLYLSRQLNLQYNGGLLDDLPEEALTLELQRSLDYYERQMRQVPPKTILFCGENITDDKLTDSFTQNLSATAKLLAIEDLLVLADDTKAHLLPLCLLALGCALSDSAQCHASSEGAA